MTDKKAAQEMRAHYRAWSEQKFLSQVLQSAQMTAKERWEAYQDLYVFVSKIRRGASQAEQVYVMSEWKEYLDRIQRFEKRRRRRGKAT